MLNPQNSPKDWENYFKNIVRLHYLPANYRDVPDKHVGDFGIECYTLSGHVFQCYLPEQVSDVKKLVDSQRNKINKDIKKFTETNVLELRKLFGEIIISRWILATSANDSAALAQFCAQKSIEVRELGISYVSHDFEILVHTESEYQKEVGFLRKETYQLNFNFNSTTTEGAGCWIDENTEFLSKLDMKLPKIKHESDRILEIRTFIIQKYLDYQNLMDLLRLEWSDIYSTVFNCIQHRENSLIGRFILDSDNILPGDVIKEEMLKLHDNILEEVKSFKGTDLEKIKWGVIADWLIRCPLDF
ncbi:hypothetical protein Sbal183_0929 [Shewanella baltica OS183]|uniref:hypothetical protein n=1 Tax=Shewanella baltica TaxID=62322 RepID=UPI0001E10876|nr:hypothetical protein [Shewanella baltica]AEG12602.1 hypothetical protein Sbal175_3368 [Shewanella baltica BA175]EHQ13856.1 hypothetical protein Sbal183_0929 [Shewanella baltica OS183]